MKTGVVVLALRVHIASMAGVRQCGTGPIPGPGILQPTLPLHSQATGEHLHLLSQTTSWQGKPGLTGGVDGKTGRRALAGQQPLRADGVFGTLCSGR